MPTIYDSSFRNHFVELKYDSSDTVVWDINFGRYVYVKATTDIDMYLSRYCCKPGEIVHVMNWTPNFYNDTLDANYGDYKLNVYGEGYGPKLTEIRPGEIKTFMYTRLSPQADYRWHYIPSVTTIEVQLEKMISSGGTSAPAIMTLVTPTYNRRIKYIRFYSGGINNTHASFNGILPFGTENIYRVGICWFPAAAGTGNVRFTCNLKLYGDNANLDAAWETNFNLDDSVQSTPYYNHVTPFVQPYYNTNFNWYLSAYSLRIIRAGYPSQAYAGDIGVIGISMLIENSRACWL